MGLPARLVEPVQWNALPTPEERWRAECERRYERMQLLSQDERLLSMDAEYCSRGLGGMMHWLENYAWMLDPKASEPWQRRIPFVPWPKQREFIEWLYWRIVKGKSFAGVPKTRELGISWITVWESLWFGTFQPGFSVLFGSRTQDDVDKRGDDGTIFAKIRSGIAMLPAHVAPTVIVDKLLVVRLDNGSHFAGEATNLEFGRSDRKTLVVLDEFAAVDRVVAQRTWMSITSVGQTTVAIWNPGPEDHITYELHMGKTPVLPDALMPLDWTTNPHRDEAWWEAQLRENGGRLSLDERDSVYGGKYGFVKTGLIFEAPRDRVEFDDETEGFDLEHLRSACYHVAGWDYGSGGSYTAMPGGCLQFDVPEIGWRLWIVDDFEWSSVQWMDIADEVVYVLNQHPMGAAHWGDPAGDSRESDQMGWAQNLQSRSVPIETLPARFNRALPFEQAIQRLQIWMDRGHIRVHERCTRLWRCLNTWTWNTDPKSPTKGTVLPDKLNTSSHIGMALLYMSMGLEPWLVGMRAQPGKSAQALGLSPMEVIEDALDGSSYRV